MIRTVKVIDVATGDIIQAEPGTPYGKVLDWAFGRTEMEFKVVFADGEKRVWPFSIHAEVRLIHRPVLVCQDCENGDHCDSGLSRQCLCCGVRLT